MVQQPPFVASSSNKAGGRPKRREDHNNNDLEHLTGRQVYFSGQIYIVKLPTIKSTANLVSMYLLTQRSPPGPSPPWP